MTIIEVDSSSLLNADRTFLWWIKAIHEGSNKITTTGTGQQTTQLTDKFQHVLRKLLY